MFRTCVSISILALLWASPSFAELNCQSPWISSSSELVALENDKRSAEIQKLIDCAKQSNIDAINRLSTISSLRFDQLVNDLLEERTALQKLSDDQRKTIGDLENDLVSRLKERDDALSQLKRAQIQLSASGEKIAALEIEREKLHDVIADQSLIIKNLQNDIARLESERTELNKQIKALADQNSKKDIAIAELNSKIEEKAAALSLSERIRNEQSDQISTLKSDLDRLTNDLADKEKELSASNALQEKTESRLSEALAKIGRLQAELQEEIEENDQLKGKGDALIRELENSKIIASELKTKNADLKNTIDGLEDSLEKTEADLARTKAENGSLKNKIVDLEHRIDASESEKSLLVKNLEAEIDKNKKLTKQIDALNNVRSLFFAKLIEILKDQKSILIYGDRFIIQSEVLFDVGSPDLNEHGKLQIKNVAKLLKDMSNIFPSDINWVLQVNGHTDIQKIARGSRFASNWELSTARALTVVKLMQAEGVAPNHLVAAGFGEYQPVDDGKSQASFAKNRRIELKLTDDGPYK